MKKDKKVKKDKKDKKHKHRRRTSSTGGDDAMTSWVKAFTEEGKVYYYHKVTRAVRWTKPEGDVARRMEERISKVRDSPNGGGGVLIRRLIPRCIDVSCVVWWQAEEEKKQRQRARLEALAEAEASKKAEQEAMDVAQSRVGPAVEKWAAAAGVVKKVKRGMAAPKYAKVLRLLLTTLHTVDHINVAEIKLDANASGGALKKSYFKVRADERPKHARRVVVVVADCVWQCAQVVRVVHPDKVPSSATPEERLAAQRVFAVLAATYESFKQQS